MVDRERGVVELSGVFDVGDVKCPTSGIVDGAIVDDENNEN